MEELLVERSHQLLGECLELLRVSVVVSGGLILDDSHRLAREGTADGGPRFVGVEDVLFEADHSSCLWCGDEPSADPDALCAQTQGGNEPTTIKDPTCSNDGDDVVDGIDDERNQGHRGYLTGVPSCLCSLRDHEVTASIDGTSSMIDLAAHVCHENPGLVAPLNGRGRDAKPSDEHRRASLNQEIHGLEHVAGHRRQEIDAEGERSLGSRCGNLFDQLRLGHRRGTQAAVATGI